MILNGPALAMLKTLPDESVDCIVTSPPFLYALPLKRPTGPGTAGTKAWKHYRRDVKLRPWLYREITFESISKLLSELESNISQVMKNPNTNLESIPFNPWSLLPGVPMEAITEGWIGTYGNNFTKEEE